MVKTFRCDLIKLYEVTFNDKAHLSITENKLKLRKCFEIFSLLLNMQIVQ